MSLFRKILENLFSLFMSKHRELFVEALFTLLQCYRQELSIRKNDLALERSKYADKEAVLLYKIAQVKLKSADNLDRARVYGNWLTTLRRNTMSSIIFWSQILEWASKINYGISTVPIVK